MEKRPECCLTKLAYLEEVEKKVPENSRNGYRTMGCETCTGYNPDCGSYAPQDEQEFDKLFRPETKNNKV